MFRRNVKDILCDYLAKNYNKINISKQKYCSRFLLTPKLFHCSIDELSKVLSSTNMPFKPKDAYSFIGGNYKLEINDGYYKYFITQNF